MIVCRDTGKMHDTCCTLECTLSFISGVLSRQRRFPRNAPRTLDSFLAAVVSVTHACSSGRSFSKKPPLSLATLGAATNFRFRTFWYVSGGVCAIAFKRIAQFIQHYNFTPFDVTGDNNNIANNNPINLNIPKYSRAKSFSRKVHASSQSVPN